MSYENDINEISIRFSSEISALEKRIADLENDVPVLYGKLDRKVNSALEKSAVEEFLLKEYEKNNNYKGNDSVLTESENYNKENANGAVESSSGVLRFSDLLGDD